MGLLRRGDGVLPSTGQLGLACRGQFVHKRFQVLELGGAATGGLLCREACIERRMYGEAGRRVWVLKGLQNVVKQEPVNTRMIEPTRRLAQPRKFVVHARYKVGLILCTKPRIHNVREHFKRQKKN
jgi:hypothetical protein